MIFETEFDSQLLFFAVITFGIIFLAVLVYLLRIFEQKEKSYTQALNLVFFKIEKNFTENPKFSEDFYNFLHSFKENWFRNFEYGKYFIVFETVKGENGFEFYLGCQRKEKKFILDNFLKFWPDFKIKEVSPPNFFAPKELAKGFEIGLEKSFILPIKTYKSAGDIFGKIIEIFQKSRGKITMQILAKPTFYSAKSLKSILKRERKIILNKNFLFLLKQKVSKPAFNLNIRFLSPAKDLMDSELNLIAVRKLFEEKPDKNYNNLKVERPDDLNQFAFNFIFRIFEPNKNTILNSEELATVFHL